MADAVRFARRCREAGLHVGVYVYSGAFIWELFFREMPQAEDWVVRDEGGEPRQYGRAEYRCYWNRNHPDAQAFYRQIVRFAVEEIGTDLVHFDNYAVGPGHDRNSVERFRRYLGRTFPAERLRAKGAGPLDAIRPPGPDSPDLLRYAWDEFRCRSLADSYRAMSRYARSLRPDVLVECNPGGVGPWIRAPRDHGRLLQGGEAFWDEGRPPGYRDGKLQSRIRTYKVARAMNNSAFCYTTTPLEMAESMAFNRDCLGAVCWFEYGEIRRKPGVDEPMSRKLDPYIRFFHDRRELLGGTRVVADAAVLDDQVDWELNVLQVLRMIRRVDSMLPVVVITGRTERRWLEDALRLAVFSVVSRPLEFEELLRQIQRMMARIDGLLRGHP
jgi:CheY-like chemotaxis protein